MAAQNTDKLDKITADARRESDNRAKGYRERSLKMYPHICGRCAREFTRTNLHELTVHHRDHNHSNNPEDGSNWELLCIYCHDNEHQRQLEAENNPSASNNDDTVTTTYNPFSDLKSLLDTKDKKGK